MATGYSVGNLELSIQTVGNGAVTSLTLTNAQLKQMLRLLGGNNSQLGKMGGNFNKTFNFAKMLGKIYFIRNYTKQMAQSMVSLVQSAIDHTETLNLWQVAMRGNIDTAEEFISKMNKAYGIAEQTLMKYQATFRNMLSTLGGVSTDVSYALSEYLTQMALDYASLYNTSIEKAMTVFQSVLSGQVRPIRSISGYDITETTIYQLYQQLGGTKTMRQLTQTEKRLLRIYAVFQQMDRSGAIGDLNKTLNNTANQMRIMSEATKELGVWIGKLIEMYIAPALPYINAFFITAKNIAQAIVKSLPRYEEFDGTIKGYEDIADAIEQANGKLLDFDKFRFMSSSETDTTIGIDESLVSGLTRYESILSNVSNRATEIADKWTKMFIDTDTGKLTETGEKWVKIVTTISKALSVMIGYKLTAKLVALLLPLAEIKKSLGVIFSSWKSFGISSLIMALVYLYTTNEYFRESLNTLLQAVLKPLGQLLNSLAPSITKILDAVAPLLQLLGDLTAGIITFLDKVGLIQPLLYGILVTVGVFKVAKWVKSIDMFIMSAQKATASLGKMNFAMSAVAGVTSMFLGDMLLSNLGKEARSIVAPIMLAVGAIGALITSILALKGVLTLGTALPVLLATIGLAISGAKAMLSPSNLQVRKNGGLVEDGLFTMNKGEVMGTFDDGSTIVANNQQIISGIKQGVYQAVSTALQNNGTSDNRPIEIYIDGEKVFQATKKNAKRHGLAFSKV